MPNPKELRKAIKNVVQETFPAVMSEEMYLQVTKKLEQDMTLRLTRIEKHVLDTLKNIETRQTELRDFMMRQVAAATTTPDKV